MSKFRLKPFFISLFISLGTGAIGSIITSDASEQYKEMYQPPLAPPGWVFPVVWTILFILMGIAAYLVYMTNSDDMIEALKVYGLQLFVNIGWSVLYFSFQMYFLAFFWLVFLWVLIAIAIKKFYEIDPLAGKLLIPYLLWVTFAGYLNLAVALHYM